MHLSPEQAAEILLMRRRARRDLETFASRVPVPGSPLSDAEDDAAIPLIESQQAEHHRLILREMQRCMQTPHGRLMIMAPPGSAKALALDTPIPTPEGWRLMGDLRIGDRVFDERGQPCDVTWVSPVWRNRPVFRVSTDCGDEIIADHDHEWLVRLCGKPSQAKSDNPRGNGRPFTPFKIKETHELCRSRSKRPMIQRAGPIELPEASLPIDPYLLGVWLGDGSSAGMRISSSVNDQPWLRAELAQLGYKTSNSSCPQLFGVLGVRGAFVSLGLLNDPAHGTHGRKHIPPVYMRGSRAQRLSLLQGLIDTDGTVCRDRGCTTFSNTNRELADGVQELVRSLGVKASLSEGRATLNGKDCGPVYRVSFYMLGSARMPRKAVLTRDQQRTPNTYIDVTPAGFADTVCIEVNSPSHLFLCGRSMTPTHNSTYATVVGPSWYLGQQPNRRVILASYGGDLARRHGRRTRQLLRSPEACGILQTGLSEESRAADEFGLTNGSEYIACGIMAGVTGNRAHGIVIDDPIKGREEADSKTIRDKTYAAYEDDLLTRLIPGGWVTIIQCMTGDTPVLMANGSWLSLRDIRPGDWVASHADGKLIRSKVNNWANQGPDCVFTIKTKSGIIVRANERHPFLIEGRGWTKLRDLKPGEKVIRAIGASGAAFAARQTDVNCQQRVEDSAHPTTIKPDGPLASDPHQQTKNQGAKLISSIGTESALPNTTPCLKSRMVDVLFAKNHPGKTCEPTGVESSASTTTMQLAACADYSATIAISQLATERLKTFFYGPLDTYEIGADEIVSIEPAGIEDVFDIQVEGTENFIAAGLVSHNTRWHEDDIAGRILPENWAGESGDIECRDGNTWRVLCLQAECQTKTDPLGREIGGMLWPEWFDRKHWDQFRRNRRTWSSLYQQIPAPAEGILFRSDDMATYDTAPAGLRIIGGSDYAVTPDGGDWTEHGVAGIAADGTVYLLDWWRGQVGPEVWIERKIDMMARWAPLAWFGEAGPIRRATEARLRQRMNERDVKCRLEWLPSINDKPTRAQSIIATAGMGRLWWPRAAWVPELQRQCLVFPAGQPDDGVDTLSIIGRGADSLGRALKPQAPVEMIPMVSHFGRR